MTQHWELQSSVGSQNVKPRPDHRGFLMACELRSGFIVYARKGGEMEWVEHLRISSRLWLNLRAA